MITTASLGSGSPQLPERLQAVNARQPNVQQNASVGATLNGGETLFTSCDGVGTKALVFHYRAQRLAYARFVVDYEN